ncbi:MAG: nucleotide exchange factor GrpE [Clostridia bacterium]|nr:nucleotide exchange factor GrpE [Clostridia bacterium]
MEEKNLNEEIVSDEEFHNADEVENTEEQDKLDVESLTEEQAKTILSEVLESNSEIIKDLVKAQEESEKFKDNWYRTTAEFENYKKRNQDLRKTSYQEGKVDAIKNILVIGDTLDRALSMDIDEKAKQGIELIQKQFIETMKALGVEEINPIGEIFTPETAEAIAIVDGGEGEESGTVKQVFKKGYKLTDKTIRYAQVVVVK